MRLQFSGPQGKCDHPARPTSSCPSWPPCPSPCLSPSWPDFCVACLERSIHQHWSTFFEAVIQRTLLPTGLFYLGSRPVPDQSIVWFKLLHHFMTIVDQCESSALASAVLCPESEARYLVLIGLIELGEFLT